MRPSKLIDAFTILDFDNILVHFVCVVCVVI